VIEWRLSLALDASKFYTITRILTEGLLSAPTIGATLFGWYVVNIIKSRIRHLIKQSTGACSAFSRVSIIWVEPSRNQRHLFRSTILMFLLCDFWVILEKY